MNNKPNIYLIDLFCGAGGVTTGFDSARFSGKQFCQVLACINHDAKAIDSHYMNHPFVKHYTEDIRQLDLTELLSTVKKIRATDADAVIVLWASLECTNFSKAKGGKTRKADSRMLGDEMYRYIEILNPDYFMVENVEEFLDWGRLRIAGTEMDTYCTLEIEDDEYIMIPNKDYLGEYFRRWKKRIIGYGYSFDDNDEGTLNAANYGACQSRKRYFAAFAKEGLPIAWPVQTHCKDPRKRKGERLKKWEPVRKALDLENHGPSMFIPGRIKSEKSWSRVYEGLIKHVAGGKDKFLIKYNSVNGKTGKHVPPGIDEPSPALNTHGRVGIVSPEFLVQYNGGNRSKNRALSTDEPSRTIDTQNRYAKIHPDFLINYNHSSNHNSINKPSPVIVAADKLGFVHCQFINQRNGGEPTGKNISIDEASRTLTNTGGNLQLLTAQYLVNYHGKEKDDKSIDLASGTVTTKEDSGLITAQFLKIDHSSGQTSRSISSPAGAVKTVGKENLITAIPFIMDSQFNNGTQSINAPIGTITANRKYHYLINPQWNNHNAKSIEEPSNTVIARLDKAPTYLITTEEGFLAIEIFETDSPMVRKVKEFMAMYGIIDIKMRMLTVIELLKIQGFPANYILVGTQADKKKFIGNAVEVTQARKIAEALYRSLFEQWQVIKEAA